MPLFTNTTAKNIGLVVALIVINLVAVLFAVNWISSPNTWLVILGFVVLTSMFVITIATVTNKLVAISLKRQQENKPQ